MTVVEKVINECVERLNVEMEFLHIISSEIKKVRTIAKTKSKEIATEAINLSGRAIIFHTAIQAVVGQSILIDGKLMEILKKGIISAYELDSFVDNTEKLIKKVKDLQKYGEILAQEAKMLHKKYLETKKIPQKTT